MMQQKEPLSGGFLSEKFGVSRQIIVHDIALLKSAGYGIISTHYGYLLQTSPHIEKVLKVCHTSEQTEEELSCIIENGGTVVDVFVWHKVYGKIEGKLNIFSKRGIDQLIEGIKSGKSTELMHVTSGYHYHTVRADSEQTLDLIGETLDKAGYIVPEI
jgi:transcriptional regulator of NAD metabolism